MARTKATLGDGVRLSDHLSASLLARAFPAAAVDECLAKYACQSVRHRKLEVQSCVYLCMALALYPEASVDSVYDALSQSLSWAGVGDDAQRLAKSSISSARTR